MNKWLLVILALLCIVACDDEVATSADVQPVASADTLHLGMVLAGNSSQTYQLKLYNRNTSDLKLTSVKLRNAETSGFRMNVDGMNGAVFTDSNLLRIAAGDSLFIFVEATFAKGTNLEDRHIDYIDIACNGKTQTVVLDALCKNVKEYHGHIVKANEVVREDEGIQVFDSLVITKDAEFLMLPGATLYLHDKAKIVVYGSLNLQGSQDKPVVIRGDRMDNMLDNLPYDNLPSQWGSIVLTKDSHDNVIRFADVHGMSDGIVIQSDAEIYSSRIKNSDGNLITAFEADVKMTNCELMNAAGSLLEIVGGSTVVTYCTLANYNFAAPIRQEALRISYTNPETGEEIPLRRCELTNCIVWGRRYEVSTELGIFDHCLVNEDPLFVKIDDENYTYDLHLSAESPCIGAGRPVETAEASVDIEGNKRSEAPSIGCYEYSNNK